MEFAITFKGDIDPRRTVALCKQAEQAGFTYAWFFDSHVLWRECYVTMAMCMEHTSRMRFGPCVTNPGVREWSVAASLFATLALQSGGRFDCGLGRGDSSRRVLGQKPLNVDTMVEFAESVKKMVRGEEVQYEADQKPVQFPWAVGYEMPVWYAAYGPKALAAAGQYGDGLILQLADPWLVKWFTDQAIEAGKAAGRDMSSFRVMSAAPVWVGDMEKARAQTRWFPAMVGNHVADLVERYGKEGNTVPKRLTDYIEGRKGYDYRHHADKDADHLDFISNDIIDSFGILGSVEQHVAKIKELEAIGVTQYNIYLMCGEEERMVEEYGKHVLPHFS
ncbi:TIGR03842 family LLM class F420-dependent oxidoreductase [Anaerolineae bacterium CFX9]|jgi:probable F420-dependent oxidoreductase|nr:TIGR03842 family LLM class F420-dependent oxidoreductase [Kamptonema cortianum]MDL1901044.1 TIGR03842 family LLM class F420-dependent oxidoreductase [Anaerolineae bacterium CFX9]